MLIARHGVLIETKAESLGVAVEKSKESYRQNFFNDMKVISMLFV